MATIGEHIFPKPETKRQREMLQVLNVILLRLKSILNAGILFDENVSCKLVSFTSNATPDTEDTTAHGLGKVPNGYIVYSQNKAGSLYDSGTAHTATNIYTKCDVASVTFKIIVF